MAEMVDVEELAGALYDGIGAVARKLRQLQVPGELRLPERAVLARLDRGGPATAADLARAEQITAQGMSATVSALCELGLVARSPDRHDRRRVLVSLTAAGADVLRRKRVARGQQLAAPLANGYSARELRALRAAVPLLERLAGTL